MSDFSTELEKQIDALSLDEVLYLVERICVEKADATCATNERLAHRWVTASNEVAQCREEINHSVGKLP